MPHFKKHKRGIKLTPEMEAKADQRVEELLHGENQNKEKKEEPKQ